MDTIDILKTCICKEFERHADESSGSAQCYLVLLKDQGLMNF